MQVRQEQRLTGKLAARWDGLRKSAPMPSIEQLKGIDMSDVWPNCMLIKAGTSEGYLFEHMGENIRQAYGRDLTGLTADTARSGFPGSIIFRFLDPTVIRKQPTENSGNFMGGNSYTIIKYRACFLPFGDEEKGVTHILAGLSFKT